MITHKVTAENLPVIRRLLGFTQVQLADAIWLSANHIYMIESGRQAIIQKQTVLAIKYLMVVNNNGYRINNHD